MFKYLTLALAAGVANANWAIYTHNNNKLVDLGGQVWLLNWSLNVVGDIFSYGTVYAAGKNDEDATQFISYGLTASNYFNATFSVTVLNYWTYSPMVSFLPFSMVPYSQVFGWQRPETGNFALWTYGGYGLQLFRVWTTFTDAYVSCGASFYDVIMGKAGATAIPDSITKCAVMGDWVTPYEDKYWQFDLLTMFMPELLEEQWYAATAWYEPIALVGEYDPLAYKEWKKMIDDHINPPPVEEEPAPTPADGGETPPAV
jgi:hypothetical protein